MSHAQLDGSVERQHENDTSHTVAPEPALEDAGSNAPSTSTTTDGLAEQVVPSIDLDDDEYNEHTRAAPADGDAVTINSAQHDHTNDHTNDTTDTTNDHTNDHTDTTNDHTNDNDHDHTNDHTNDTTDTTNDNDSDHIDTTNDHEQQYRHYEAPVTPSRRASVTVATIGGLEFHEFVANVPENNSVDVALMLPGADFSDDSRHHLDELDAADATGLIACSPWGDGSLAQEGPLAPRVENGFHDASDEWGRGFLRDSSASTATSAASEFPSYEFSDFVSSEFGGASEPIDDASFGSFEGFHAAAAASSFAAAAAVAGVGGSLAIDHEAFDFTPSFGDDSYGGFDASAFLVSDSTQPTPAVPAVPLATLFKTIFHCSPESTSSSSSSSSSVPSPEHESLQSEADANEKQEDDRNLYSYLKSASSMEFWSGKRCSRCTAFRSLTAKACIVCGCVFIQRQKLDSWVQSPCIRREFFRSLGRSEDEAQSSYTYDHYYYHHPSPHSMPLPHWPAQESESGSSMSSGTAMDNSKGGCSIVGDSAHSPVRGPLLLLLAADAPSSVAIAAPAAAEADAANGLELERFLAKKATMQSAIKTKIRTTGIELVSKGTPSSSSAKKPKKPKQEFDAFLMDFGVFYANDSAKIASSSSGPSGLDALNQSLKDEKKASKHRSGLFTSAK